MGEALSDYYIQDSPIVQTEGLHVNKIQKIVDELFQTGSTERTGRADEGCNGDDGEGDLIIMEDDLIASSKKINPNKAAGVDDIPGIVVKLIEEKTTEKLLRVLNEVNRSGKILAIWKVVRVVLIPKPGKYPTH